MPLLKLIARSGQRQYRLCRLRTNVHRRDVGVQTAEMAKGAEEREEAKVIKETATRVSRTRHRPFHEFFKDFWLSLFHLRVGEDSVLDKWAGPVLVAHALQSRIVPRETRSIRV
jgi:hypothetical protein